MNNRKLYFWLGGAAVFLLLMYSFYLAFIESEKAPPLSSDKIILPSTQGPPVEANNFLLNPKEKFSYGAVLAESNWYKIIFFSEDEGFIITLKQKPLDRAQALAESEFLKQLGIDQQAACALKAYVTVPRDVDETVLGENHPLSFCPGGKSF